MPWILIKHHRASNNAAMQCAMPLRVWDIDQQLRSDYQRFQPKVRACLPAPFFRAKKRKCDEAGCIAVNCTPVKHMACVFGDIFGCETAEKLFKLKSSQQRPVNVLKRNVVTK